MAIIIYSQMAKLPQYQKALPAPAPKPEHAPETLMGTPVGHNVNDSAEFHPDTGVATMPEPAPTPAPAPATPAPGPVLAPEPVMPPAPVAPPAAQPHAPQLPLAPAAPLKPGEHLLKSKNPLDNYAGHFQDEQQVILNKLRDRLKNQPYDANSLPPAVVALSSGSGRSASTVRQFASAGLFGSISTTRQLGAP